jgi:hypothetical protein
MKKKRKSRDWKATGPGVTRAMDVILKVR